MKVITINQTVNPYALTVARNYRGYNQTRLCKAITGLTQSRLSKFENGRIGELTITQLKEIMEFLEFPFEFLYKDIKEVNVLG